jgi:hypothetical protein
MTVLWRLPAAALGSGTGLFPRFLRLLRHRKTGLLPAFMFGPSPMGSATMASADIRRPIPATFDAGSTRQSNGLPRVRRVTFVPDTCRIYGCTLRVILGFGFLGPLARMQTPHMRFLFVRPALCLQLPSDPGLLRTPLLFG